MGGPHSGTKLNQTALPWMFFAYFRNQVLHESSRKCSLYHEKGVFLWMKIQTELKINKKMFTSQSESFVK